MSHQELSLTLPPPTLDMQHANSSFPHLSGHYQVIHFPTSYSHLMGFTALPEWLTRPVISESFHPTQETRSARSFPVSLLSFPRLASCSFKLARFLRPNPRWPTSRQGLCWVGKLLPPSLSCHIMHRHTYMHMTGWP